MKIYTENEKFDPVLNSETYEVTINFVKKDGITVRDKRLLYTSVKGAHKEIEKYVKKNNKHLKNLKIIKCRY